ncbi:MAG TPA: 23S rRNA (guanosine(2251)-2'-O)-methyltransferase RlmB [Candidatus Angelobacter sp.]|jgi:23S rRNA (guanosine2251-2'-O)-methyltransferase|nr:23S rRNA (guanosine(2251)-2'-O)-methyltransferase RlmB [Candidatus Angelobacter sp.]
MQIIYGIHAVAEALVARERPFEYVDIAGSRTDPRILKIIQLCWNTGVEVRNHSREHLTRLAKTDRHQGVIAVIAEKKFEELDEVVAAKRGSHSFLLVLDGIQDPRNLGAIIRTAEASGGDGIVIPTRRAAGVTGTVAKTSAGALEHLPMARVTNIGRAIEHIKSKNIWTVGLDERGGQVYDTLDYNMDCALVLGSEGHGLHEQVRKKCDFLVSIPMMGKVSSLNVSVAAAVVMYEIARQRRNSSQQSAVSSQPEEMPKSP